jgi:hypothetical protein
MHSVNNTNHADNLGLHFERGISCSYNAVAVVAVINMLPNSGGNVSKLCIGLKDFTYVRG